MNEKTCTGCGEIKPESDYRLHQGYRLRECKLCKSRASAAGKAKALADGRVVPPAEKRCGSCREVQPAEQFARANRSFDGLQGYCRTCVARKRFERASRGKAHGMTEDQWRDMLLSQEMSCAICQLRFAGLTEIGVDHDHACCAGPKSCGQCVRGLLCRGCNSTLGHAKDNPATLRAAADYLERSK